MTAWPILESGSLYSAVSAVCIGMSLRMELRDICTVFLAFFRKGGSSIKNGEKLKMG